MKSCRTAFLRQSTLHLLPLQPKEIQVRSAFKEAPQQPWASSALPQRTPRTSSARHAASAAEPEPVPAPCRRAVTAIEQKHRAAGLGRATATHGTPPRSPRLGARPPRATRGCRPRAKARPRAAPRLPPLLTSRSRPPRSRPGAPARRAGEAPRRPGGRRSHRRRVPRGAAAVPRPWG